MKSKIVHEKCVPFTFTLHMRADYVLCTSWMSTFNRFLLLMSIFYLQNLQKVNSVLYIVHNVYIKVCVNPGGVLKKIFNGEVLPSGPTPYPFIYLFFFQKRHPFRISFIGKKHPFHFLIQGPF